MSLLTFFKRLWFDLQIKVQQTDVSMGAIHGLMSKEVGDGYFETLDNTYSVCDYENLKLIISLMPIKYEKYTAEHDCENFAMEFCALAKRLFPKLAVGYCHVNLPNGSKHALNFVVYKLKSGSLDWTFIEPQTNKLSFVAGYKPYLMIL